MSNSKKLALVYCMSGALAGGYEPRYFKEPRRQKGHKILPKGAREFHFSRIGEVFSSKNERTVFSCVAINEENARRKFISQRF